MLNELYITPQYHKNDEPVDTAPLASTLAVGACGSCFYALERTVKKVDAYFNIERIKKERQNTSILPQTMSDLDFSAKSEAELDEYKKIYHSIQWKEIAQWTACAFGCGLFSFSLI